MTCLHRHRDPGHSSISMEKSPVRRAVVLVGVGACREKEMS